MGGSNRPQVADHPGGGLWAAGICRSNGGHIDRLGEEVDRGYDRPHCVEVDPRHDPRHWLLHSRSRSWHGRGFWGSVRDPSGYTGSVRRSAAADGWTRALDRSENGSFHLRSHVPASWPGGQRQVGHSDRGCRTTEGICYGPTGRRWWGDHASVSLAARYHRIDGSIRIERSIRFNESAGFGHRG